MDHTNSKIINIGIYSGSFDPPGIHHKKIAEKALENIDYVILVPCGSGKRKDKIYPNDIFRKRIVKMGFEGIKRCYIDNVNLDMDVFMSNYKLEERYKKLFGNGINFFHIVGSDLTCIYKENKSRIEYIWENGEKLWRDSNFIVIPRQGSALDHLPHNCIVLEDFIINGSSTKIKKDISASEDILEGVKEYILEKDIYNKNR